MNQVLYQFSRSKVERGDFSHFLVIYAPDKLPRGRPLRDMMNTLTFVVEGFDDDPRELHSIPEVRQFYAAFYEAWPYWLYFCNVDTEGFYMMVLRCLPSIAALKIDHQPGVEVKLDKLELLDFIRTGFGPMNSLCDRAGLFEDRIHARTKAIFEYFKLPFDAPPSP